MPNKISAGSTGSHACQKGKKQQPQNPTKNKGMSMLDSVVMGDVGWSLAQARNGTEL